MNYIRTIIVSILIIYLSLFRAPSVDFDPTVLRIPHLDKLIHYIMYLTLGTALLIDIKIKNKLKAYLIMLIYCSSFGALMEFLQSICTEHRVGDIYDFIANCVGAATSYILYILILKVYERRKIISNSPDNDSGTRR